MTFELLRWFFPPIIAVVVASSRLLWFRIIGLPMGPVEWGRIRREAIGITWTAYAISFQREIEGTFGTVVYGAVFFAGVIVMLSGFLAWMKPPTRSSAPPPSSEPRK